MVVRHKKSITKTILAAGIKDGKTQGDAGDLKQLSGMIPETIDVTRLQQPRLREDYAAWISLGEEVLQMQQERCQWGVNADTELILMGIMDDFAAKRELTDDELNKALAAA